MADTLFGPTPEELQALLRADKQAFLDRAATVSPAYSAGAGVGNLLGGVVSSIFGLENPELKKARVMQEIQKKIRAENPGLTDKGAYYDIAASYLDEAGLSEDAFKAQNLANEFRIAQEDRDVNTRYKQAQIGNLESEAQARLLPKPYEAKSNVGKLRADLAYAKSIGDTETVKAIEAEITTETEGKKLKPQEKADQVIYDALIKQYGGDETKAALAFNEISVDQKMKVAAAGAGNSLDKALTVLLETTKAKDKENAIKAVDSKGYGETVGDKLREMYPDLNEADSNRLIIDYKNAKKKALKSGKEEDEAESFAEETVAKRISSKPGFLGLGGSQSYTKPAAGVTLPPPAPALPKDAKLGKVVSQGQYKGKREVYSNGKLIGYSD
jgi:hypothetical protein